MITIPLSTYKKFHRKNKALRWGQEFYIFMEFDKITNSEDKIFVDKLYIVKDETAMAMIKEKIDYGN